MKCAKCGTEFYEGIFCPECGTKYDEEEAKRAEALRAEEESKQRELEIEKAKAEQERLAKERAEQEAIKAEQESRTFNGVLYATVEEKEKARQKYEVEQAELKKKKSADDCATACLVLSLISLLCSCFTAIPSIIFGIVALNKGTKKKTRVIVSFVIDGLLILLAIVGFSSNNSSNTSGKTNADSVVEAEISENESDEESESVVADQNDEESEKEGVSDTPTPTEAPTPTPTPAPTEAPTPTPTVVTLDTSICGTYEYLDAYWDDEWGRAVHNGYGCIEVYSDGTDLYANMYYILDPMSNSVPDEERSGKLSPTGKKGEYTCCGGEVILKFNDDSVTLMYNMASGEMDHEYLRSYE